jgi:hypothetical protein
MQKFRQQVLKDKKYAASIQTIITDARKWKPSCNKQPATTVSSSLVSRLSTNSAPDFIVSQEFIDYTNSKYKRFNHCAHCRYLPEASNHRLIFQHTSHSEEYVDESDWGSLSCSNSNYIEKVATTLRTLTLDTYDYLGTATASNAIWDQLFMSTYAQSQLNSLARTAVDAMSPKLDTGFSAPQFLVELIELKSLFSGIRSLFGILADLYGRIFYWGTIKDITSSYLAHQFGLMPLIDDIKTMVRKYHTACRKVFDFIDNEGKVLTLHYEKKLQPTDLLVDTSALGPNDYQVDFPKSSTQHPWYFARDVVPTGFRLTGKTEIDVQDLEYHATMRFKYRLPNYGPAMKSFLASLDHWGVNLSISDIWEVVPFSFLVDWCFDIGKWLEGLDFENLPVQLDIIDFCDSLKYKRTDSFDITGVEPAGWTSQRTTLSKTTECYYRWTGLPIGTFNGPKFQQWKSTRPFWKLSILVSLVVSRNTSYYVEG